MGIVINSTKNGSELRVDGDLTIYEVEEYKKELKKIIKKLSQKNKKLDIDLSEVNEADASGIQLLATLSKQIMKKGCKVEITSLSEIASEAFELFGLMEFFNAESGVNPS